MAAAVSDFRPSEPSKEKIKRTPGGLSIRLDPTDDILVRVAAVRKRTKHPAVVVGFAAESQDLVANARAKLNAKGLSLIVANDINAPDAGFAVDTNRVTLIDAHATLQELPLMTKAEVAAAILERVIAMLGQAPSMPGM
jgi:phosphopantothenoylcysteine decarboxylase/phosphopantothenate--cysteine ligase